MRIVGVRNSSHLAGCTNDRPLARPCLLLRKFEDEEERYPNNQEVQQWLTD
jgi:hypothetical protein